MARFEVSLASDLRFTSVDWAAPADRLGHAETVEIGFGARAFVWHEVDVEHDPTLTVELDANDPPIPEEVQRLLSALAYATQISIEAIHFGTNPARDARAAPTLRIRRSGYTGTLVRAPTSVEVLDDPDLRVVLAYHREAVNARSPFYRFLALWNALDVLMHDRTKRGAFLKTHGPVEWRVTLPSEPVPVDVSDYFWESGRCAVAHAVRDQGKTPIDPDLPEDRMRLARDSLVLERLVRLEVGRRWPCGVRLLPAE